jgi:hypothetical protein
MGIVYLVSIPFVVLSFMPSVHLSPLYISFFIHFPFL